MTSGSAGSKRSNSSISRVRTLVRSSSGSAFHQCDQPVERRLATSVAESRRRRRRRRRRCRRARRRRRRRRRARCVVARCRNAICRTAPLASAMIRVLRPGSPDTPQRRVEVAGVQMRRAPAPTRGRPARALAVPLAPPSLPAVAFSSESTHPRNCSGGCRPWKLANGCPAASATTVGTACTPKICATRGVASTLTVASDHLPPSLAARLARACRPVATLASLRGDHSTHDDRHLVGPDQHLGFEIGLGDLARRPARRHRRRRRHCCGARCLRAG